MSLSTNSRFELALQFAHFTHRHLFLTGKAGTGKTTFLKQLRETTTKKIAVLAPTGVAAINAGGMTIHSFFQLPFGPFIPGALSGWNPAQQSSTNEHSLLKNIRFNASKRDLLLQLDLLVIDEVSMVRSDTLDAIDIVLRHFRKQPYLPFGGLQMLFIGDLFQLPPVAGREEWGILQQVYKSPFFFDALVMQEAKPLYLELTKIYRQEDERFINLLNRIRNANPTQEDIDHLNSHYNENFQPKKEENYITLTSHNAKADAINRKALEELKGKSKIYKAEITGDFNERSSPAEVELNLKEGAQVMFIKNDKGEERRYYNGKIGIIHKMTSETITVKCPNEEDEITVEKEEWKNIRYSFNKEKDRLEEEELGTLKQYPLRLAWAITIHKSQGLTFDKAVIDAGESFAAGQVYVALSRLRSMDKMVLCSKIYASAIQTDYRVIQFAQSEMDEAHLVKVLQEEQDQFASKMLVETFNFQKVISDIDNFSEAVPERTISDKYNAIQWSIRLQKSMQEQLEIGQKFMSQLNYLLLNDKDKLHKRTQAGAEYFLKFLSGKNEEVLEMIKEYRPKQRTKKFIEDLGIISLGLTRKMNALKQAVMISEGISRNDNLREILKNINQQSQEGKSSVDEKTDGNSNSATPLTSTSSKNSSSKNGDVEIGVSEPSSKTEKKKGESKMITLELFREGLTIPQIAEKRELVVSTVENHLSTFIETGEVSIQELIEEDMLIKLIVLMQKNPDKTLSEYRDLVPEASFHQLRAVRFHLNISSKTIST